VTLSPDELHTLRHALGLTRAKKSYRNHYAADPNNALCLRLERMGLLQRVGNEVPMGELVTYRVTGAGMSAVDAYQ
jgi:hypothetical protein